VTSEQQVSIKVGGPRRATRYGVVVRNPRERPIYAVLVEHEVPLGFRFLGAEPQPRQHARRLVWSLPALAPGASEEIRLKGMPASESAAALLDKATFHISYVRDPGLVVTVAGPRQMRLGEEATFRLRVLNAGDQVATSPVLFCRLASTVPGSRVELLESRLGPLAPGQSKVVNLNTQVRKPGAVQCQATVIATGWPEVSARLEVRVDFGAKLGKVGRAAGESADGELTPGDADPGVRHLLFGLAGRCYAVLLEQVVEVERVPPWTPVPNVPDWLLGVANRRGDIVSLVDLCRFVGLPSAAPAGQGRFLVVRSRGGELTTGLVVDRIFGMRLLSCRADGGTGEEPLTPYAQGVAQWEGRTVTVLDLDRLLLSPALRQFEAG
jgi:purine-binding chemotaxis protein CheW